MREDRSAVRRQVRGQPHAHIGDQGDGDTGGLRLLLEQVDTLGAVKDSEMGCLADGRDQPLEDGRAMCSSGSWRRYAEPTSNAENPSAYAR